jgi:transposase
MVGPPTRSGRLLPRECKSRGAHNRVRGTDHDQGSHLGLDVHAAATVACVVDAPSGEMSTHRLAGRTSEVTGFCRRLGAPVRVAYEAGPTGFELARARETAGVECVVAAPGKIERPAQDRVKTDRRDAERLVRLLMIGGLHPVRVQAASRKRFAISSGHARTSAAT